MRIGIDAKVLGKRYTGIAVYLHEMLRFFSIYAKEDEFFLFTNRDFELSKDFGPNIHKVVYKTANGSLKVIFGLSQMLKKYEIELFWGPEHILPLWNCPCKRVVTIHDLAVLMNPKLGTRFNSFLAKFFVIPSCKKADRIIAISKSTAKDVIRLSGVDLKKVEVIYNGDSPYKKNRHTFNELEVRSIDKKLGIKDEFFLFVGTIEPRKNIPTIIKGYNIYRDNGGKGLLVIAGGLGWRFEESLKSISESKYTSDIIMVGYCSNLEKEYLYGRAKCLLFPSLYEGLGLPIIEAMSLGTPVITSRISSMPEVGGNAAFYIDDVYDAKALAKTMFALSSMDDVQSETIQNKCKDQAKKFSRESCARDILELFHKV